MAVLTKGYSFGSTEQVTSTKLHTLVDSATITAIVNNDIDANAAILENKIDWDDSSGHTHSGASDNGTKVDLSAPNAIGGTTPADGTFDALVGTTIDGSLGSVTPAAIVGTTLKANTSLELATGTTVTGIADEDDMTSDSATLMATQQSIKAYTDTKTNIVWLTTPLTSTSYDGDAFSSSNNAIDTSAVFSAPAGIKAALVGLHIADGGSAAASANWAGLYQSSSSSMVSQTAYLGIEGVPNSKYRQVTAWIPCDANGDFYLNIVAASSMVVYMKIWGYAIV